MVMQDVITSFTTDDLIIIASLAVTGFTAAALLTPIYTTVAFKKKLWKKPRTDALTGEKAVEFNKLHKAKHKRNIPTMAGVVFVIVTALVTLGLNYSRAQTLLPLVALVGAGLVGLLDDIINLGGSKGTAGLQSRFKFLLILGVALIGGLYFVYKLDYTSIAIPFYSEQLVLGGFGLIALFTLVVVSTANAVNITDGLDGLSGGLLISAFTAYTVIALLQGNIGIAGFCATVAGTLFTYTWFNIYPARFFMGDVGSFSLGASLGVVAMLTDTVLLLPIIGAVFVLETGSVIAQVTSKRFFGRKIFRVAPIHHHYEAVGWPETKVTMRFWVLGQIAAVLGVVIGVMGGLI